MSAKMVKSVSSAINVRRIILHIGRHKSGTSSLQHFFKQHKDFLSQNGILYPKAGSGNKGLAHHELAFACNQNKRDVNKIENIISNLKQELTEDHHTVLISSESFQNVTKTRWLKLFLKAFPKVQVDVYCYIREFADYMISAFRQAAQNQSQFKTFEEFCLHRFHLRRFFGVWRRVGNLNLRWFHPDLLQDGDIISDFMTWADLPIAEDQRRPFRNPSIGGNLLWLKMAANKEGQEFLTYPQMARLAQKFEEFQTAFYVSDARIKLLRTRTRYNKIFEKKIGPVPLKSWTDCPILPQNNLMLADIETIHRQFPDLNVSRLLEYEANSQAWF